MWVNILWPSIYKNAQETARNAFCINWLNIEWVHNLFLLFEKVFAFEILFIMFGKLNDFLYFIFQVCELVHCAHKNMQINFTKKDDRYSLK